MRIDRIDIIRVLNPFSHPFETSFTKFENRDALLVKVYSEGLIGWAECKAFFGSIINVGVTTDIVYLPRPHFTKKMDIRQISCYY